MIETERLLCEGAELMDIALSENQVNQLLTYHELIIKWNKVYNLSAIRDPIAVSYTHLRAHETIEDRVIPSQE